MQNRAYAANQLSDLHQKLTKAQTSVSSTRPPAPVLIDEKAVIKQKPQDKREESALSKAVKDRLVWLILDRQSHAHILLRYSDKIASEAQHGLIA